jgi:predicted ABC-type ATPase
VNKAEDAIAAVLTVQEKANKPLAVVLAGHNGSGKSTLWYKRLAPQLEIPLVNADRMMLSILPEPDENKSLPAWASKLRDEDESWMGVAQKGVEAFVAQAMGHKVPFAVETVFSYLVKDEAGRILKSKVDLIRQMRAEGYFVLLIFVGLADAQLSIGRVQSRKAQGGHDVQIDKLKERFPRTQEAMKSALDVADASLLVDNSRTLAKAFSLCRVQIASEEQFDIRNGTAKVPRAIQAWMPLVSPA